MYMNILMQEISREKKWKYYNQAIYDVMLKTKTTGKDAQMTHLAP